MPNTQRVHKPEFRPFYDDIYVDFTQARVELGDGAKWNGCTHREIQIPQSWSAGAISIIVNAGSFQPGQRLYLYVVDENGSCSADGYPLVLGRAGRAAALKSRASNSPDAEVAMLPKAGELTMDNELLNEP
jgi:hypothetical protein